MAKNRTDKCRWPSKYSPGGWVTATQFIIELICEKQAAKKHKDLPIQFWKLPEWQKEFVSQTRAANKLVKKYGPKPIIQAIKKRNIWSLRPKWVEAIIKEEFNKLEQEKRQAMVDDPYHHKQEPLISPAKTTKRQSRSKIDDLMKLD